MQPKKICVRSSIPKCSHFLSVNNLVNFRNNKDTFGYLKMTSVTPTIDIIVSDLILEGRNDHIKTPIFEKVLNCSHFGIFLLGSTCFLHSFLVMGQNQKYDILY